MKFERLEDLLKLLDKETYIAFLQELVEKGDYIKEIAEIRDVVGAKTLTSIIRTLGEGLYAKRKEVIYPIEMIIVPRYPLSKVPIIKWAELAVKSFDDPYVNSVKYVSSKLGTLINTGFILRHFVLIDIDIKDGSVPNSIQFDVATRRGFHIIRFVRKHEALGVCLGDKCFSKYTFINDKVQIEFMSGPSYLGSYPLQSRYLSIEGKTVNVRSYKLLSKEAQIAFESADLTTIESDENDIEALLKKLLKAFGFEGYAESVTVRPIEVKKEALQIATDGGVGTPKVESWYNQNPIPHIGLMTYDEFKEFVRKNASLMPICLYKALFERLPKGVRFFHGQLLRAIIPHFVYLDEENMKAILFDWYERCGKTKSDFTRAKYLWLYFTGKLRLGNVTIRAPSRLSIPPESFSTFKSLGYCDKCPIADRCMAASDGRERRRIIIQYLMELIRINQP